MITTMQNLKKKVGKMVANTGLVLSKNNPYWANAEQIASIEQAIEQMVAEGTDNPDRRYEVTSRQRELLTNWVLSFKTKYLVGL